LTNAKQRGEACQPYSRVCDGMTYEEIEANYPEEFALRRENKLGYRYPRGESYLDVISRLDPLIQELESYQEPVLIVGHQGVLRLIYAYFMVRGLYSC
jgi:broad specificity phosphatase PhoE